ncbi:MAG: hypothetical protein COB85_07280 [Bacteroidetes bacterium]|nr:MAG: hypothetical protein COB85_07280 [Bacteroidota bacterium]
MLLMLMFVANSCRQTRARSEMSIKHLSTGCILVRLHTAELQLKLLREADNFKAVSQLEENLRERNIEIVKAFRMEFKFCPVYFFFSNNSNRIRQNKVDSIFVNDNLENDPRIKPVFDHMFIVDVGDVAFQAFGGTMKGILVMDNQFKALERPFPYYVRRSKPFPVLSKGFSEMVEELNFRLVKYYLRQNS